MATRSLLSCSAGCLLLAGTLLAAGCGSTRNAAERAAMNDPSIVAAYDDATVSLDDFEAQYARSVGGREAALDDSLAAYQDFLERYVNFRLKVEEGLHAGYDRDPSILSEIRNYRASFAKPYLLDKEVLNPIITDLYEKSKEMIEASHILLRVAPDAPPEDTLAAYTRMEAIRDSVLQGVDFGDLAFRHSEDPSAARGRPGTLGYRGWLGYFTAGRMVAPFEDQAYRTPVGQASPVFRTRYGYHLLFVHDRRPAVPEIHLSHLMLRPEQPTPEDSARVLQEIQSLKKRIEAGESFADLAREYSVDKASGVNGGELGELRFDNYQIDPTFREAAFAIDSLNTVSDVVITPYGYHLLMVTDREKPATLDEKYEELKLQASRLPRTREAEHKLAQDVLARYGARIDSTALLHAVADVKLDSLMIVLGGAHLPDSTLTTPFVSLGDSTYVIGDLAAYLKENQVQRMTTRDAQLWKALDDFLDQIALDYEAAALENRDEEFRQVMQEFRDGLVLFRLMEDSVWTAAAQDSAGVAAYYEAHREKYRFPERTRIIQLFSPSDSLLQATVARLDDGLTLAALAAEIEDDDYDDPLSIDTMMVSGPTESVYDYALSIEEGAHTAPVPYQKGRVVLFRDGQIPPRAKTLEEARTEVVNDYQQVLEDRLIQRLRAKYHARTFPERLARAFREEPAGSSSAAAATQ